VLLDEIRRVAKYGNGRLTLNSGHPDFAHAQTARVAKARGAKPEQVNQIIAEFTEGPDLGLLGEPRVNVLLLNLALDQHFTLKNDVKPVVKQ